MTNLKNVVYYLILDRFPIIDSNRSSFSLSGIFSSYSFRSSVVASTDLSIDNSECSTAYSSVVVSKTSVIFSY